MAGKFKVRKITKLSKLKVGDTLPKSDLALQDGDKVVQFQFYGEKIAVSKTVIKPGIYQLANGMSGTVLSPIELGKKRLLLSVTNTKSLLDEANRFFNKLHIYEELERPKKRGVLLYSSPGLGKSSTIAHFCLEMVKTDPGTVVMVWPTAKVSADDVCEFLAAETKWHKKCTKLILVIEDIGGNEAENLGQVRGVDSGILNLLDGVAVTFSLPTFIIATTNHPENLLESLADRPGRFDLMVSLEPPPVEERLALMEFISKKPLTEEEKALLSAKRANALSIAHLEEIVIRSRLHDKTYAQVLEEILAHRAKVKKNFDKSREMGFDSDA